ncbi:hypothetical protein ACFQT0_08895 [Hymenobacter humi]|uniref:Peptidase M1 membrane alanine aminopeptidase domain-containing protein n=1 Tax=Hymenobacter humi TaxID=1411620 RepID=A0ABW2U4W4_9BACT
MTQKKVLLTLLVLLGSLAPAAAQLLQSKPTFTRADSLRGGQTPLRTCYDINYYHLDVKLDPARQFISGSNLFRFTATQDFTRLQFDLFANLQVEKVLYQGQEVPFTREANAVFVTFPKTISKGSRDEFWCSTPAIPSWRKRRRGTAAWSLPRTPWASPG